MSKRIISESINIRINVGNYQHIEITKQAQEEISYETEAERLALEESLTNDLTTSVIASMRAIPAKLGKGIENAQEVEDAISKAIPEWLNTKDVPNIANMPKKHSDKVALEQKANKDEAAKDILDVDVAKPAKTAPAKTAPAKTAKVTPVEESILDDVSVIDPDESDEDLFEDEELPAKSEVIEETPDVEIAPVSEVETSVSEVETVVVAEAKPVEVATDANDAKEEPQKETATVTTKKDSFSDFFDDDDDMFD